METDAADPKNCSHHCSGMEGNTDSPITYSQMEHVCLTFVSQLVSFGLSNEMMVTFKDDNLVSFRHLFLKGYKDHRQGSYALYTKSAVYDHIHFIIHKVLTCWRTTNRSELRQMLTTRKTASLLSVHQSPKPDCG